jgi:hypothetical protein
LVGSVEERQCNSWIYLYDRFRIGAQMKAHYLSEDTPELRARLASATKSKAEAADQKKVHDTAGKNFACEAPDHY